MNLWRAEEVVGEDAGYRRSARGARRRVARMGRPAKVGRLARQHREEAGVRVRSGPDWRRSDWGGFGLVFPASVEEEERVIMKLDLL